MEEKKNGLVIPFIIVIVLLLGLASYICYDKFLKPSESTKCVTKSADTENKSLNDKKCEESKNNQYDIFANNMKAKRSEFDKNNTFYKWRRSDEGNYYVYLDRNGTLYISFVDEKYSSKYTDYKVADKVLSFYIIDEGVGEGGFVFFINEDGTVGKVDAEKAIRETGSISIKNDIGYKNIVAISEGIFGNEQSGAHYAIFMDIDGNMFSDGFKEMNK